MLVGISFPCIRLWCRNVLLCFSLNSLVSVHSVLISVPHVRIHLFQACIDLLVCLLTWMKCIHNPLVNDQYCILTQAANMHSLSAQTKSIESSSKNRIQLTERCSCHFYIIPEAKRLSVDGFGVTEPYAEDFISFTVCPSVSVSQKSWMRALKCRGQTEHSSSAICFVSHSDSTQSYQRHQINKPTTKNVHLNTPNIS